MIGYNIEINPYGNISGGSDEVFPGSSIDIYVNGEFPVDIGANDLTLTDTFSFSYSGNASYYEQDATITLNYDNGFPMGASATLYLIENGTVVDSLFGDTGIQSGTYNSTSYQTE